MERRGFFGRMAAGVVAAVAGLCVVKTAKAQPDDTFETYRRCMESRNEYVQILHDIICDHETKLAAAARCVEACRIMQDHGIKPTRFELGCGNYEFGFIGSGVEGYWPDPVTALIEAEPLYLAWLKERETKLLADKLTSIDNCQRAAWAEYDKSGSHSFLEVVGECIKQRCEILGIKAPS